MIDSVNYLHRTYAGVLGKIIGVYLGRPFENWRRSRIERELGEIWYYVNHAHKGKVPEMPVVVTDDDVSGTFCFLRALADHGYNADITSEQIGHTWLNYIIENKSILWWGGLGNSTEHTAFLRMKRGIMPPRSGSIGLNGQVVAEQIGAQIFIDGWAMVSPGDPARAARLAGEAARVSHDGEAVHAAQLLAAMEALAYVESDLHRILDRAIGLIPADSVIRRMVDELRYLRAKQDDWRAAHEWLDTQYGPDKFGGGVHVVPNHGLIHLALLWGDDDFTRSLMIANTCGWDTDCNSGNVGCFMGIKNGLEGIDHGPDWRGPVADRIYIPTADGGRSITDAATQALEIVNTARRMSGLTEIGFKNHAPFHFELPGSVQGFSAEQGLPGATICTVENVERPAGQPRAKPSNAGDHPSATGAAGSTAAGRRALCVRYRHVCRSNAARVRTDVFTPPEAMTMATGYQLSACPRLHAGQRVETAVSADPENRGPVMVRPMIWHYDANNAVTAIAGEGAMLAPGAAAVLRQTVPDTGGMPVVHVGIEIASDTRADGAVYLDSLRWEGTPTFTLGTAPSTASAWKRQWIEAADHVSWDADITRISQDSGRGLLITGNSDWHDYRATVAIQTNIARAVGLALRVRGLRRYHALLITPESAQLVTRHDAQETVLAELPFKRPPGHWMNLTVQAHGDTLRGEVNGLALTAKLKTPSPGGAVAVICEEGRCGIGPLTVQPIER